MPAKRIETPLDVIAPVEKLHYDEMLDLVCKAFSSGHDYWDFDRHCRTCYIGTSHYSWPLSRIGIADGTIVTHWGIWDYPMRVGSATLRVAGVGVVATHGHYLKRGLMSKTIRAWLADMDGGDVDMTILFGISDFYHRFGYVFGWAGDEYVMHTRRLPEGKGPKLSCLGHAVTPELDRLANRASRGLTGMAVRPTYSVHRKEYVSYAWAGRDGKPVGFVTAGEFRGRWVVVDHAGDVDNVLLAVRELADRDGAKKVHFLDLHARSPLARRLRQGTADRSQAFIQSGGPMIRTLNLRSCLGKLAGELTRRLKGTTHAGFTGSLTVADPRETVTLAIAKGVVSLADGRKPKGPAGAIRGGEEIAQLLIGTHAPDETVEGFGTKVTGAAKDLIGLLFPAQEPNLARVDHY